MLTAGTGDFSLGGLAGEEGSDTVGDGVGDPDGEGVGLPLNFGDGKVGTLCPGALLITCLGFWNRTLAIASRRVERLGCVLDRVRGGSLTCGGTACYLVTATGVVCTSTALMFVRSSGC